MSLQQYVDIRSSTLLNLPGKVYARVLARRVDLQIQEEQCSVCPGCGTVDLLLTFARVLEGTWELHQPMKPEGPCGGHSGTMGWQTGPLALTRSKKQLGWRSNLFQLNWSLKFGSGPNMNCRLPRSSGGSFLVVPQSWLKTKDDQAFVGSGTNNSFKSILKAHFYRPAFMRLHCPSVLNCCYAVSFYRLLNAL